MSESPEVAALPAAVKRLITVRNTLTRERDRVCEYLAKHRTEVAHYEQRLSDIDEERNDIDRAIRALRYPDE